MNKTCFDAQTPGYEPWIWTELLAFDNTAADLGVSSYLDEAGFTPKSILLLLCSPELVMRHDGLDAERLLPPDVCSRHAQPGNERRRRQDWTTWQLRDLVTHLRRAGVDAYVSLFTVWEQDKFGREWLSEHPECLTSWDFQGYGLNLNPFSRLADGTLFEDLFLERLLAVMKDYGFAGWHGPDGWGPLPGGDVRHTDFSDGMTAQFAHWLGHPLPPDVRESCGNDIPKLKRRSAAVWRDMRKEWIRFHAERTASFWKKITTGLHGIGCASVINSAWTKAPFESLCRYGIDYRLIAECGVDAMVVETCAASLALGTGDRDRHDEAATMLMMIKACVPDLKLLFLHTVKDVNEEYDAIHHSPTNLERDIFALANRLVCRRGSPRRSATGFAVCLGDGIIKHEWQWLKNRWDLAFGFSIRRACGMKVLWSDAFLDRQLDDYLRNSRPDVHRLVWKLSQAGAALVEAVRVDELDSCEGPLLAANYHLLPEAERHRVLHYTGGPVLLLGEKEGLPEGFRLLLEDSGPGTPLGLCVGGEVAPGIGFHRVTVPGDPAEMEIGDRLLGFRDDIAWRPVSDEFFQRVAAIVNAVSNAPETVEQEDHTIRGAGAPVTVSAFEEPSGDFVVIIKNANFVYARRWVDMKRPLQDVCILSGFPANDPRPEGMGFSIKVPPRGVVLVRVRLAR